MNSRVLIVAVSIATTCVLSVGATSVAAQDAARCDVKITTPQPGDKVGKAGKVRGTATIPKDTYLWVLDHMKDLAAEWWPQAGRPAVIEQDGRWVIFAAYGETEDVGEQFEVAAVVVDANTNTRLREWSKTAKKLEYPPIEFPDSVEGCVPVKVTVSKASH